MVAKSDLNNHVLDGSICFSVLFRLGCCPESLVYFLATPQEVDSRGTLQIYACFTVRNHGRVSHPHMTRTNRDIRRIGPSGVKTARTLRMVAERWS